MKPGADINGLRYGPGKIATRRDPGFAKAELNRNYIIAGHKGRDNENGKGIFKGKHFQRSPKVG